MFAPYDSSSNLDHARFSGLYGKPYWMHYDILYPIAKGVWGCFSQDIVHAVHISIKPTLITGFVQSSLDACSTEDRLTFLFAIGWNWIVI